MLISAGFEITAVRVEEINWVDWKKGSKQYLFSSSEFESSFKSKYSLAFSINFPKKHTKKCA